MDNIDVPTAVGLIIGLAGLGYALYQGTERTRLERYARSEAWYLYSMANNATGIIQHALQQYWQTHAANLDPNLVGLLSESSAFAQDLFKETVRQIQLSEPEFDFTSIDRWVVEGKVSAAHKPIFSQIAIEKPKRRWGALRAN